MFSLWSCLGAFACVQLCPATVMVVSWGNGGQTKKWPTRNLWPMIDDMWQMHPVMNEAWYDETGYMHTVKQMMQLVSLVKKCCMYIYLHWKWSLFIHIPCKMYTFYCKWSSMTHQLSKCCLSFDTFVRAK